MRPAARPAKRRITSSIRRWRNTFVRNLYVEDNHDLYTTENNASRFATVRWSRVTEPELAGYNIYRMCSFSDCEDFSFTFDGMTTFACEPNWIRLNSMPVSLEPRVFYDSSVGGMRGCFLYAVRPVGPNRAEGPINKMRWRISHRVARFIITKRRIFFTRTSCRRAWSPITPYVLSQSRLTVS
jgi:hypothetical protein